MSPRQKSTEYYNQKEASLLGFLIHYLEDGIIKKVYVDILADNGAQTASAVIQSLNFIKSQNFFRRIDKDNYIVWADCGNHFRCYELLHYFLIELVIISCNLLIS